MKASWCALAGAVVLAMAACSQVGSPDTASSPRASRERSSPRAQKTTVPKVVPGGGGKGNGITLPEDLHLRYRVRSSTGDPGWVETDILKSDFRVRFLDEDNRPQLELIYLNGRYFFCEHSAAY
ncbi:MAG TPA: hypothetical protein VNP73_06820, partial [Actinomycetota bacterium]|nr:hypothetical protein [Actinomycetota bacterium]